MGGAEPSGGSLGGVPVAVKDIFCVDGVPATAGSRILEGYVPPYTATAVERLLGAGARVLGKTNMDEFAMGSSNENSAYGEVRNPWDPTRVPGGSSGGSAAAVAGGLAPCAIGTDTGGSIRQPAALCGVVGLKPTYGAISRSGMIAFASSLDQCGPFTRDVTDAALMLAAMQGLDPRDSTAIGDPGRRRAAAPRGPEGPADRRPARALERRRGDRGRRPRGLRALARALRGARRRGRRGRAARTPATGSPPTTCSRPAEASANLARYDGVRFGLREPADHLDAMYERTRAAGFGAEVKRRIMLGTYALSSGFYDAYYGRAQRVRTLIAEDFAAAYEKLRPADHPDLAVGRVRHRRARRRPARDVHVRLLHRADVAGRDPGDLDPLGDRPSPTAAGRELPVGPADRRPGLQRVADPRRRARARGRDRLRRRPRPSTGGAS